MDTNTLTTITTTTTLLNSVFSFRRLFDYIRYILLLTILTRVKYFANRFRIHEQVKSVFRCLFVFLIYQIVFHYISQMATVTFIASPHEFRSHSAKSTVAKTWMLNFVSLANDSGFYVFCIAWKKNLIDDKSNVSTRPFSVLTQSRGNSGNCCITVSLLT